MTLARCPAFRFIDDHDGDPRRGLALYGLLGFARRAALLYVLDGPRAAIAGACRATGGDRLLRLGAAPADIEVRLGAAARPLCRPRLRALLRQAARLDHAGAARHRQRDGGDGGHGRQRRPPGDGAVRAPARLLDHHARDRRRRLAHRALPDAGRTGSDRRREPVGAIAARWSRRDRARC
ncbi:hypothetical protein AB5I41_26065 [Sphingomonas sp. MMS24-JH45]